MLSWIFVFEIVFASSLMYLVCRLNGEEFSFKIHSGCWQNSLQLSVWVAKLLPAATSKYPVSKVRPTVFHMIFHMTTWFTEWSRTVSEESASKTFFPLRYGLEVRWRAVYKEGSLYKTTGTRKGQIQRSQQHSICLPHLITLSMFFFNTVTALMNILKNFV